MNAMRTDIEFTSDGTVCRGWFYKPRAQTKPAPAIVMSHGITAVKEQYLDRYAERFAGEGFAVLVFDYRHLGASDGVPRGRIVPQEQHDDTRAALGWVGKQPEVDPARIGLWGTSFSGGHALFMGAMDPRVKAVVAQVPAVDAPGALKSLSGADGYAMLLQMLADDHANRNAGNESAAIPVVAPPGQLALLATPDSYDWFTSSAKTMAPNWFNQITLESIARVGEYTPDSVIHLIAPKPLLMQVATKDTLIPPDSARRAFARAGEPKKLEEFDCGHFDMYGREPWHDKAVSSQVAWFKQHL